MKNIIVFVKQVPKNDDVKLDKKTGNLMREGVESVINPLDLNALEAALEIKEKNGGKIIAVSMGPMQAKEVLYKALAMGCDEAVLLSDRAFGGADTLATGYVLSQAVKKIGGADLLLFGQHAVDAETAQTGPIVSAALNFSLLTRVINYCVDQDDITCELDMGSTVKTVKAKLPTVITLAADCNIPRYMNSNLIFSVKDKPFYVWNSKELDCEPSRIGALGSPSINKRLISLENKAKDSHEVDGTPSEIAEKILEILKEKHLYK